MADELHKPVIDGGGGRHHSKHSQLYSSPARMSSFSSSTAPSRSLGVLLLIGFVVAATFAVLLVGARLIATIVPYYMWILLCVPLGLVIAFPQIGGKFITAILATRVGLLSFKIGRIDLPRRRLEDVELESKDASTSIASIGIGFDWSRGKLTVEIGRIIVHFKHGEEDNKPNQGLASDKPPGAAAPPPSAPSSSNSRPATWIRAWLREFLFGIIRWIQISVDAIQATDGRTGITCRVRDVAFSTSLQGRAKLTLLQRTQFRLSVGMLTLSQPHHQNHLSDANVAPAAAGSPGDRRGSNAFSTQQPIMSRLIMPHTRPPLVELTRVVVALRDPGQRASVVIGSCKTSLSGAALVMILPSTSKRPSIAVPPPPINVAYARLVKLASALMDARVDAFAFTCADVAVDWCDADGSCGTLTFSLDSELVSKTCAYRCAVAAPSLVLRNVLGEHEKSLESVAGFDSLLMQAEASGDVLSTSVDLDGLRLALKLGHFNELSRAHLEVLRVMRSLKTRPMAGAVDLVPPPSKSDLALIGFHFQMRCDDVLLKCSPSSEVATTPMAPTSSASNLMPTTPSLSLSGRRSAASAPALVAHQSPPSWGHSASPSSASSASIALRVSHMFVRVESRFDARVQHPSPLQVWSLSTFEMDALDLAVGTLRSDPVAGLRTLRVQRVLPVTPMTPPTRGAPNPLLSIPIVVELTGTFVHVATGAIVRVARFAEEFDHRVYKWKENASMIQALINIEASNVSGARGVATKRMPHHRSAPETPSLAKSVASLIEFRALDSRLRLSLGKLAGEAVYVHFHLDELAEIACAVKTAQREEASTKFNVTLTRFRADVCGCRELRTTAESTSTPVSPSASDEGIHLLFVDRIQCESQLGAGGGLVEPSVSIDRLQVFVPNELMLGKCMNMYFAQRKAMGLALGLSPPRAASSGKSSGASSSLGGSSTAALSERDHLVSPAAPASRAKTYVSVTIAQATVQLQDDEEPDDAAYAYNGFFPKNRRRLSSPLSPSDESAPKAILTARVTEVSLSVCVSVSWRSSILANGPTDSSLLRRATLAHSSSATTPRGGSNLHPASVGAAAPGTNDRLTLRGEILRAIQRADAASVPVKCFEGALTHGFADLMRFEIAAFECAELSVQLSDYVNPVVCVKGLRALRPATICAADLRRTPSSTREVTVELAETGRRHVPFPARGTNVFDTYGCLDCAQEPTPLEEDANAHESETGILVASTSSSIPMKIYFEIPELTAVSSHVSFGECTNPGLVALNRALDRALPPSSDTTTPRVGWWDKMRYLMHGRITFETSFEARWLTKSPHLDAVDDSLIFSATKFRVSDFEPDQFVGQAKERLDQRVWVIHGQENLISIRDSDHPQSVRLVQVPQGKVVVSFAWQCLAGGDHYVQLHHLNGAMESSKVSDMMSNFRTRELEIGIDFELSRAPEATDFGQEHAACMAATICWRLAYPILRAAFRGMFPPYPIQPPKPNALPTIGSLLTNVALNVRADRPHILWWDDVNATWAALLRGKRVDTRLVLFKENAVWKHEALLVRFAATEFYCLDRVSEPPSSRGGWGAEFGLGAGYVYGVGLASEPMVTIPAMRLTLGDWTRFVPQDGSQQDEGNARSTNEQKESGADGDSKSSYYVLVDEPRMLWTLKLRDRIYSFFATIAYVMRAEARLHELKTASFYYPNGPPKESDTAHPRTRYFSVLPFQTRLDPTLAHTEAGLDEDSYPGLSRMRAWTSRLRATKTAADTREHEDDEVRGGGTPQEVRYPTCSNDDVSADGVTKALTENYRDFTFVIRWGQICLSSGSRHIVVFTAQEARISAYYMNVVCPKFPVLVRKEIDVQVTGAAMYAALLNSSTAPTSTFTSALAGATSTMDDANLSLPSMFLPHHHASTTPTRWVKSDRPPGAPSCLTEDFTAIDTSFETMRGLIDGHARPVPDGGRRRGPLAFVSSEEFYERALKVFPQLPVLTNEEAARLLQDARARTTANYPAATFYDIGINDQVFDSSLERVAWAPKLRLTDIVYTDTSGGAHTPPAYLGMHVPEVLAAVKSDTFFVVLAIVRDLLLVAPPPDVKELAELAAKEEKREHDRKRRLLRRILKQRKRDEGKDLDEEDEEDTEEEENEESPQLRRSRSTLRTQSHMTEKNLKAYVETELRHRDDIKSVRATGFQQITYEVGRATLIMRETPENSPSAAAAETSLSAQPGKLDITIDLSKDDGQDGSPSSARAASTQTPVKIRPTTTSTSSTPPKSNPSSEKPTNNVAANGNTDDHRFETTLIGLYGSHKFALDGSTSVEFELKEVGLVDLVMKTEMISIAVMDQVTTPPPFLRADAKTSQPIIVGNKRVTIYELIQGHLYPGARYRFIIRVRTEQIKFLRNFVEGDDAVATAEALEELDNQIRFVPSSGTLLTASSTDALAPAAGSQQLMPLVPRRSTMGTSSVDGDPSTREEEVAAIEAEASVWSARDSSLTGSLPVSVARTSPRYEKISTTVKGMFQQASAPASTSIGGLIRKKSSLLISRSTANDEDHDLEEETREMDEDAVDEEEDESEARRLDKQPRDRNVSSQHDEDEDEQHSSAAAHNTDELVASAPPPSPTGLQGAPPTLHVSNAGLPPTTLEKPSSSSSSNVIRSGFIKRPSVPKALILHPEPIVQQPWNEMKIRRNFLTLAVGTSARSANGSTQLPPATPTARVGVLELHRNDINKSLHLAPRASVKLHDVTMIRRSRDATALPGTIDVFYSTPQGDGVFTIWPEESEWSGAQTCLPWVAAMYPGLSSGVLQDDLEEAVKTNPRLVAIIVRASSKLAAPASLAAQGNSSSAKGTFSTKSYSSASGVQQSLVTTSQDATFTSPSSSSMEYQEYSYFRYARLGQIQIQLDLSNFYIRHINAKATASATVFHQFFGTWEKIFQVAQRQLSKKIIMSALRSGMTRSDNLPPTAGSGRHPPLPDKSAKKSLPSLSAASQSKVVGFFLKRRVNPPASGASSSQAASSTSTATRLPLPHEDDEDVADEDATPASSSVSSALPTPTAAASHASDAHKKYQILFGTMFPPSTTSGPFPKKVP